jgi:hypothetical protein
MAKTSTSGKDRFTIDSAGNVGIGTTSPAANLHVRGGLLRLDTAISTLDIGMWGGAGDAGGYIYNRANAGLVFGTNNAAAMTIQANGNVGIGTTNPCAAGASTTPANCKLSVAGAIQAQEVVVNTGWSDYVFHPTYRLKSLPELAAYIRQNQHLPDIPSETEVKEKGIGVGEMESKLLAKVEELTLHMIHEHERNDRLEQKLQELERQNRDLQEKLARQQ